MTASGGSTGYYGGVLGSGFGAAYRAAFEAASGMSLDNVAWYMDPARWPSDPRNAPWIDFWRGLDNAIGGSLGAVRLGDDFWRSYGTGPVRLTDNVVMNVTSMTLGDAHRARLERLDARVLSKSILQDARLVEILRRATEPIGRDPV